MPPSSSGLGRKVFNLETGVQFSVGVLTICQSDNGLVMQNGRSVFYITCEWYRRTSKQVSQVWFLIWSYASVAKLAKRLGLKIRDPSGKHCGFESHHSYSRPYASLESFLLRPPCSRWMRRLLLCSRSLVDEASDFYSVLRGFESFRLYFIKPLRKRWLFSYLLSTQGFTLRPLGEPPKSLLRKYLHQQKIFLKNTLQLLTSLVDIL